MNAIEITIRLVRADGPVGHAEIANELIAQCQGVLGQKHADVLAADAIRHGLNSGWLVGYDGMVDAYVMRSAN